MATRAELKSDKWIGEIVGVFTDPIIVMPGGWGESLPDKVRTAIKLQRLLANIESCKTGKMTATDAEACAYLFTASLSTPIGYDWTQIYMYVFGRTVQFGNKDRVIPDDIKVETLTPDQERDLTHLKDWIYEARVKNRKRAGREPSQEPENQPGEAVPVAQPSFF